MPNFRAWLPLLGVSCGLLSLQVSLLDAADSIQRRSGGTAVQGDITEITKTEVTIQPTLKTRPIEKIPANDIARVRFDGEPIPLNLLRNTEENGRYEDAIKGYTEHLKEAGANARLKTDLEFLIARSTAKLALANPARLDESIKLLEAFRKANTTSFRYYEALQLLGAAYAAKKDYSNARTVFALMKQAPWNDYKMGANVAEGRALLAEGKVDEAQAAFASVVSAPATEPADLARRYEAMVGQSACLQKQNKPAAAVKLLDDVVTKISSDEVRIQAEAYVRQGDCYRELKNPKQAVLSYLHVDILFSREVDLHAESLYHLSKLWSEIGQDDRGRDARSRLVADYPNSEWAKMASGGAAN